ncbi:MAG: imelysin family protein [Alphaproteobacteria bacterium]
MTRTTGRSATAILLACMSAAPAAAASNETAVLSGYADIAHATYEDSLVRARALDAAIDVLIATPSEATLAAAREAWRAARVPYQQSEAFRFGNPLVDDWEGRVNAWPLDEGVIDYVDPDSYGAESDANDFYTADVIANPTLTIAGREIDATVIDAALIQSLHEVDEVEANVTIGYHAIEFLLWGQDLNGTGPGAGNRPASDFDTANCTHGNCDRRIQYLTTATDLLVGELEAMTALWDAGGAARSAIVDAAPERGLAAMLTGLGSLSYGELAGERIQLGLMLHDPEEEHDCFSDNTHFSHYYDQVGMMNVYLGRYQRIDGSMVERPSLAELVAAVAPEADARVRAAMDATLSAMDAMVASAESGKAYDQLLAAGDAEGNAIVQAVVDALKAQTVAIEGAVGALGLAEIAFEGSDSLDDPEAVFQ